MECNTRIHKEIRLALQLNVLYRSLMLQLNELRAERLGQVSDTLNTIPPSPEIDGERVTSNLERK